MGAVVTPYRWAHRLKVRKPLITSDRLALPLYLCIQNPLTPIARMKKKTVLITVVITAVSLFCLRESGFITLERYSESAASYISVQPVGEKFTKPVKKIVVRDESARQADIGNREPEVLYLYTNSFVFDQDLRRRLPIYKSGTERSYLHFEFVYENRGPSGGIVSITKADTKTVGFRSIRAMRAAEFKKLIEVVASRRGLEGVPIIYDL